MRRYVEVRLELSQADIDPRKLREAKNNTERFHNELWSRAVAAGARDPRAVTTGLFIQSLNDLIDLHAKRVMALENHVPESIFLLLYFVAILSMGLVGYGFGIGGRRNLLATMTAAFLIASVILLIVDLDRPGRGLIRAGQHSLVDLRDNLNRTAP